jgi:hypothetical protein
MQLTVGFEPSGNCPLSRSAFGGCPMNPMSCARCLQLVKCWRSGSNPSHNVLSSNRFSNYCRIDVSSASPFPSVAVSKSVNTGLPGLDLGTLKLFLERYIDRVVDSENLPRRRLLSFSLSDVMKHRSTFKPNKYVLRFNIF